MEVPERHVVTSAYNTYHQIPEHHVVTSAYTTTHQIPEQHTVTGTYNTYKQIPHQHTVTGSYNTYKQIPHTHVVTGSYTTTHEIPERHVVTQQYNTYAQVAHQHTVTSAYTTTHQIPERHVVTQRYNSYAQVAHQHVVTGSYNSYAQVAHQHVVTGSYQVAHTSYTKVPYSITHTKTVEVPAAKAGYRRLAEDAGTTAHGLKKITKDEATTTLTKSGSLPYGYKVISTHTEEIPKYTTKTITHTAYKTVAKPYTVVSHVICNPRVAVSYQCPQCTGSSNYVAGYGADFDSQDYPPAQVSHAGYATHVYHHVYHAERVKSLSTDGELKWTATADGSWKAQGHDDWKTYSANLQQAASTETAKVAHHSSAVGAVVGVSVGCVAMAVVALYVVKRRSVSEQKEVEDSMSSIL